MKCFKKKLKDDSKSKNFEFKYEYETNFKHEPTLIGLKFLAV